MKSLSGLNNLHTEENVTVTDNNNIEITYLTRGKRGKRQRSFKDGKGEFRGGPIVRTPRFHCRGPGSIPCQGIMIPQAAWHGQIKKK